MSRIGAKLAGRREGFSVFEMLIVIALSLIIGSAVIALLMNHTRWSATQNRNIINQESLRDALRFMADEIHAIGSSANEPCIINATASYFEFIGDLDGDGSPDKVIYSLNDDNVDRTLSSTADGGLTWADVRTDTVIDGVTDLTFTYFAFGNVVPGTVDDISSVEIKLTLSENDSATAFTSGRVAPQAMVIRSTIRNRLL